MAAARKLRHGGGVRTPCRIEQLRVSRAARKRREYSRMSKLAVVGLLLVVASLMLGGCSGSDDQVVFQNVSERVSWNDAGTRLAFTSRGGNEIAYVYSITNTGTGLRLLTPTDNDDDLTDEGGSQPAWSPDGADIAIIGRRGGSQSLFLIDPVEGSTVRETRLTDQTVAGADAQPSWSDDSSQIVFVSTKEATGRWEIVVINRNGTGRTVIARNNDDTDAQWPVFTPDGTHIIYQSRVAAAGVDTSLRIVEIATGTTEPLGDTEGNSFRDEAPSISPNGQRIAFHSNRAGDFDIWAMDFDGGNITGLTRDARSDGYPVFSPDGARIAFTRDREVWTMLADGTDQDQVTRRFQN